MKFDPKRHSKTNVYATKKEAKMSLNCFADWMKENHDIVMTRYFDNAEQKYIDCWAVVLNTKAVVS